MKELLTRLVAILQNDSVLSNYFARTATPQSPLVLGDNIFIKEVGEIPDLLISKRIPFLSLSRMGIQSINKGNNKDLIEYRYGIQINFISKGFKNSSDVLMGNLLDMGIFDITKEILRVLFENPLLEQNGNDSKFQISPVYDIIEIDLITGYGKNYFLGGRSLNIFYEFSNTVKYYKNNIGY